MHFAQWNCTQSIYCKLLTEKLNWEKLWSHLIITLGVNAVLWVKSALYCNAGGFYFFPNWKNKAPCLLILCSRKKNQYTVDALRMYRIQLILRQLITFTADVLLHSSILKYPLDCFNGNSSLRSDPKVQRLKTVKRRKKKDSFTHDGDNVLRRWESNKHSTYWTLILKLLFFPMILSQWLRLWCV